MNEIIPSITENPEYYGATEINSWTDIIKEIGDDYEYYQLFNELSNEEIYKKYAQLPKEKLLKILIFKDKQINELAKQLFNNQHYYTNKVSNNYYNCLDWDHCSNPYRDCVNCPLYCITKYFESKPISIQFNENNNYGNKTICYEIGDITMSTTL